MSTDRTSRLKTTAYELVKQYMIYDGSGRLTSLYTAHTDAETGTPCVLTQYTYDGTSGRIEKRKESDATWDASWDI